MPYLTPFNRQRLAEGGPALTGGDLNYLFSQIIRSYIQENGLSYATLNEVTGALECCKMELYRRVVGPYEDTKIKENGDVYF